MWKRIRPLQLLPKTRSHSGNRPCTGPPPRLQESFRHTNCLIHPPTMTVRHAWNWSKIKPDPSNPFFARRSTKNTPHTAVLLLRNAEIPMLQIRPPVFMPSTSDQVQQSLNILLFMSDFNNEPRPLAFNALACASTGLIHYIQITNQHLSLILPTYNITHGGRNPGLIPPLLKTFLESSAYAKVGFGAYEDAHRVKDQYGITCKNILDTHWMAKVMGIGSTNVGMLHQIFGHVHDVYIPGRINFEGPGDDSTVSSSTTPLSTIHNKKMSSREAQDGRLIDPRRWDWESHGSMEQSRELIRCIAQDAYSTLGMYDPILARKYRPGYEPPVTNDPDLISRAKDFLLTSVPRGTPLPVRSLHHLLKGPFMSSEIDQVDRDAMALALVRQLIDRMDLVTDKADSVPVTFQDPTVLGRRVALPGIRSSDAIMNHLPSRKLVAETFGCRADELRLMQDSDYSRKPDKIQDLECFLGVYEWLEFLPGAATDVVVDDDVGAESRSRLRKVEECGRKEGTLLALYLNFGMVADRARQSPAETKRWVLGRIGRLVERGVLLKSESGLIRVEPSLLRVLKGGGVGGVHAGLGLGQRRKVVGNVAERNKALMAN